MSTYFERLNMAVRYYDTHASADLELVALTFDVRLVDLETALLQTQLEH